MLCHEGTRVAENVSMQSVNESLKVNNKVSGNIVNLSRASPRHKTRVGAPPRCTSGGESSLNQRRPYIHPDRKIGHSRPSKNATLNQGRGHCVINRDVNVRIIGPLVTREMEKRERRIEINTLNDRENIDAVYVISESKR